MPPRMAVIGKASAANKNAALTTVRVSSFSATNAVASDESGYWVGQASLYVITVKMPWLSP